MIKSEASMEFQARTPRKPQRRWTKEEDTLLRNEFTRLAEEGKATNWGLIAQSVPGKDSKACRKRWNRIAHENLKGPWSQEEDQKLHKALAPCSLKPQWALVAKGVGSRSGEPDREPECAKRWKVLNGASQSTPTFNDPGEAPLLPPAPLASGTICPPHGQFSVRPTSEAQPIQQPIAATPPLVAGVISQDVNSSPDPQSSILQDGEQPIYVAGSRGRRGILPSAPGRPAAPTGTGASKNIAIPQKNADGKLPCPYCTKAFLEAGHLKRHLLRHTGERLYMCVLCRDTFGRSDILKRHFKKCSIRRGNPTGMSHLSHPQAHVKKHVVAQQKAQEGKMNQIHDLSIMQGDNVVHPFGIVQMQGNMSNITNHQNQLSESSSISRMDGQESYDRCSMDDNGLVHGNDVHGSMTSNVNLQLSSYNAPQRGNGIPIFQGSDSAQKPVEFAQSTPPNEWRPPYQPHLFNFKYPPPLDATMLPSHGTVAPYAPSTTAVGYSSHMAMSKVPVKFKHSTPPRSTYSSDANRDYPTTPLEIGEVRFSMTQELEDALCDIPNFVSIPCGKCGGG
ncbi:fungal-specific transcription factor domain-containing protein [Apiospora marii]|uniref:fungal-specific transcription factor domain-containing protein n=1 Tax=Apiospora marii TaxID=335849 RepID=UPI0031321DA6